MERPDHDIQLVDNLSPLQSYLAAGVATQLVVVGVFYPRGTDACSDVDSPRHSTTSAGLISAIVGEGDKSGTLGNAL